MKFERRLEPQQGSFNLALDQWSFGEREVKDITYGGIKSVENKNFVWWEDLSENGQKLYRLLVKEIGDIDLLPIQAAKCKCDLKAAMSELRSHDFLDESRPKILKLK